MCRVHYPSVEIVCQSVKVQRTLFRTSRESTPPRRFNCPSNSLFSPPGQSECCHACQELSAVRQPICNLHLSLFGVHVFASHTFPLRSSTGRRQLVLHTLFCPNRSKHLPLSIWMFIPPRDSQGNQDRKH